MNTRNNSFEKEELTKSKKLKLFFTNLFSKLFGFENKIDITNELVVRRRRNFVIKNIIFLLNIVYFLLLLIISLGNLGGNIIFNWIITAGSLPLTFVINFFLGNLLKINDKDSQEKSMTKQLVAMYMIVSYLFVTAILFYLKINIYPITYKDGRGMLAGSSQIIYTTFEAVSYILFYVVMVIIALFQDKKVLFNSGLAMFAFLTIFHFFVTHKTYDLNGVVEFKPVIIDIVLRSFVFTVFMLVLFATVSISQYMAEGRRKELIQKMEVQNDFINITKLLFNVIITSSKDLLDLKHIQKILDISNMFAPLCGFSEEKIKELKEYILITKRINEVERLTEVNQENVLSDFESLRKNAKLGALISKRIQLAQKCENIARAYEEERIDYLFVINENKIQPDKMANLILLVDLYITQRQALSYKRPSNHETTMKAFEQCLHQFIDEDIYNRFKHFHEKFEAIYNNFDY